MINSVCAVVVEAVREIVDWVLSREGCRYPRSIDHTNNRMSSSITFSVLASSSAASGVAVASLNATAVVPTKKLGGLPSTTVVLVPSSLSSSTEAVASSAAESPLVEAMTLTLTLTSSSFRDCALCVFVNAIF